MVFSFLFFSYFFLKKNQVKSKRGDSVIASSLLEEADELYQKGKFLKARDLLTKALEASTNAEEIIKIKRKIEDINIKILFSPILDECSTLYVVNPGDTLGKIAKKFNTTVALIKRANKLKSDKIYVGQKLKVNTCKFSIVIDKSQNLLFLKRNDKIFKTYVVATGKNNSTPSGTFKIINKIKNPTWFKTGAVIPPNSPENILGSRWMGLDIKGYGIHGTNDGNEIGKQVTLGCIRMRKKDVEELFDIVPVGTEVIIID